MQAWSLVTIRTRLLRCKQSELYQCAGCVSNCRLDLCSLHHQLLCTGGSCSPSPLPVLPVLWLHSTCNLRIRDGQHQNANAGGHGQPRGRGGRPPRPGRVTKIKLSLQWGADTNTKVFGPAPLATTAETFGEGYVKDYPLYSSVEKTKEVGRARGLYITHDRNGAINQEINTFTFWAGKYKGSSLTVQGDWVQGATKQELAITGGTGVFAFARGSIRFKNTPTLYPFDGSARLKDVGCS